MANKPKQYRFEKFTDSYIMYHKKVPKFLFVIITIICLAVVGFFVWSALVQKTSVIKVQGVVTVEDKTPLTVLTNAKVTEVFVTEGATVSTGDKILQLDTTEIDLQISQLQPYIDYYQEHLALYDRLITYTKNNYSKDEEGNCFDKDDIVELEFYNYMSAFENAKKEAQGLPNQEEYVQQIISQYLDNYYTQRNSLSVELDKYNSQLDSYIKSKANYIVTANSDGIVHFDSTVTQGTFLQAGMSIGSVFDPNDSLYVECYVLSQDRPNINVGDSVKIALNGVSQNEYGVINGKLNTLSSNATMSEDNYYYIGKVDLEKTLLESNQQNISLSVGMTCETRIIYHQTSYLYYFLEQLGIKIK